MDLYLPNGYLNMAGVLTDPHPFIVVVGARGTGKTYGTLEAVKEHNIRFAYFRRTAKILELIMDPALHIYKKLNAARGWRVKPEYARGLGRFYDEDSGEYIGIATALSTFANTRGFSGEDIELLIYDEFIPEPTERVLFNAYTALLNAIETIGRNRELEGRPPLKVLLLSNSDKIYSDIIAGLGIGDKLLYMQENGQEVMEVSSDLLLIRPASEVFTAAKKDTVLYRLTAGQSYADVALANNFPIEDRSRIGPQPLNEYRPLALVRGICIYKHKNGGRYFVTRKVSGSPKTYDDTEADLRRYIRENGPIWNAHQRRKVYFSGIDVQTEFKNLYE